MLSGIKPNALMYIIWARANIHIPGVKQLGQTNNASPIQLNISPVNIRLEKVYLKEVDDFLRVSVFVYSLAVKIDNGFAG